MAKAFLAPLPISRAAGTANGAAAVSAPAVPAANALSSIPPGVNAPSTAPAPNASETAGTARAYFANAGKAFVTVAAPTLPNPPPARAAAAAPPNSPTFAGSVPLNSRPRFPKAPYTSA